MEASVWSLDMKPVPDWISDRAKISGFDEETGEPIVMVKERSSGGLDIMEASGKDILLTLKTKDSLVLYSKTHPLMSVTPHQMELLYGTTDLRD